MQTKPGMLAGAAIICAASAALAQPVPAATSNPQTPPGAPTEAPTEAPTQAPTEAPTQAPTTAAPPKQPAAPAAPPAGWPPPPWGWPPPPPPGGWRLPPPASVSGESSSSEFPPEEPAPLKLAGRVGFGIGLWLAPIVLAEESNAGIGGTLGVRGWASERVVLIPSLRAAVQHTDIPDSPAGEGYTEGSVSTSFMVGHAAYRGKSTCLVLAVGPAFAYSIDQRITAMPSIPGSPQQLQIEEIEAVSFSIPLGFMLEQFFTPRISIVLGAEAPIFEFTSTNIDDGEDTDTLGASLDSTKLVASVFFYTD